MLSNEEFIELLKKGKDGDINEEDQKKISEYIESVLQEIRKKNPEKYLELLRVINEALSDFNQSIGKLREAIKAKN